MKFVSAASLALIGCLVGFNSANAQGAAMKTTPTTKILAIGTINPGFEQSQVFAVLPEEVRETVDLYLDGKIEQWYSLQGKPGVAFIINVTDPAVAHEMLEKLPLGKAHMMSFELIPIGPLNPLRFLQGMQQKRGDMQDLRWKSCAGACLPKRDRGIGERRAAPLDLPLNTRRRIAP